MKALFKLEYVDGSEAYGNLFKGDWKKVPEKEIKCIVFAFLNKRLKLEGFKEYNILVERCQSLSGGERILKVSVVGRKENGSEVWEFDLDLRQLKRIIKPCFMEFDGMMVRGWRKGTDKTEGKSYVG